MAQPAEERGPGIARRDDDGCLDHAAVGQLDAPDPLALAEDGSHPRAGPHRAAGRLERAAHGVGDGPAAADRSPDGGDVLQGVGQGAEAGARRVGGEPPDRRADDDGGRHHGVLPEEVPQDGADAAPAPPEEVAHAARPPLGHASQHGAGRRRLVGQLDQELGHWHRGGQVAAVAVDLTGVGERQRGQRALGVVERRPGRAAGVQEAQLGRIDVEVAQAVRGQVELLHDRRGAEHAVIAVADVHPGAERVDGRRAPAHLGAGLQDHDVHTGAGEVGGADQPVVARSDDDRAVVHGGHSRGRARRREQSRRTAGRLRGCGRCAAGCDHPRRSSPAGARPR